MKLPRTATNDYKSEVKILIEMEKYRGQNVRPSELICYRLIENLRALLFDNLIYPFAFQFETNNFCLKWLKELFYACLNLQRNFYPENILNNLRELQDSTNNL